MVTAEWTQRRREAAQRGGKTRTTNPTRLHPSAPPRGNHAGGSSSLQEEPPLAVSNRPLPTMPGDTPATSEFNSLWARWMSFLFQTQPCISETTQWRNPLARKSISLFLFLSSIFASSRSLCGRTRSLWSPQKMCFKISRVLFPEDFALEFRLEDVYVTTTSLSWSYLSPRSRAREIKNRVFAGLQRLRLWISWRFSRRCNTTDVRFLSSSQKLLLLVTERTTKPFLFQASIQHYATLYILRSESFYLIHWC